MKRKDFLKRTGLAGLSSIMIPLHNRLLEQEESLSVSDQDGNCVVIPQETAGPFPMDLSDNPEYFRQDTTEGKEGVSLDLTLNVVDVNNGCTPISNARVDIWYCDKDGAYSGFTRQPGGRDTRGETFCRGIQLTDAVGRVRFRTIYPGWYPGRVTHIHFRVYLNNGLAATSQLAFPDEINNDVYHTRLYSNRGVNTSVPSNSRDGIFNSPPGAFESQLCAVSENGESGGYNAYLNIGIAV